ncbi:hypothetical protein ESZ50_01225 [Weissella muntiaci]|uniref:Uncharacterized protein n=1 Tax=Weissella muntiaci TaxID=2508881 RepID=A0A6C2CB42_9LACO|nr:hypothetical protein [Weissella muntiaci]TYC50866.1 hypothetical protein ESZ50_01225 [Weissella muntiaci]
MSEHEYINRKSDGKYWRQVYEPSGKRIMAWTDELKFAWTGTPSDKRSFVRELFKEEALSMEDARYNGLEEVYFEDVDRKDF